MVSEIRSRGDRVAAGAVGLGLRSGSRNRAVWPCEVCEGVCVGEGRTDRVVGDDIGERVAGCRRDGEAVDRERGHLISRCRRDRECLICSVINCYARDRADGTVRSGSRSYDERVDCECRADRVVCRDAAERICGERPERQAVDEHVDHMVTEVRRYGERPIHTVVDRLRAERIDRAVGAREACQRKCVDREGGCCRDVHCDVAVGTRVHNRAVAPRCEVVSCRWHCEYGKAAPVIGYGLRCHP